MRESSGTAIGYAFLALWLTVVICAWTDTLDDVIVWMFGLELIHTVLSWSAVILVIAAIVFLSRRGGGHGFAGGHAADSLRRSPTSDRVDV